ncbi:MAG TPA: hypothetical protein VHO48_05605, partial [Anaerolineaceae bacterium]|nr:hypothetical protein [Anaerolineaceae bacterium]
GLGFQILLSLQSLRYEEMLPLLLALLMLSGVTDLWSARLRLYIGGFSRIDLNWNSTRQGKTSEWLWWDRAARGRARLFAYSTDRSVQPRARCEPLAWT